VIRQAEAGDEPDIRNCAEQAYARYVPLIGRKPAPMIANFGAQIAAGHIYVATGDGGIFQGFIVFYREEQHILPSFWRMSQFCQERPGGVLEKH
jgi:hypothetical protein